MVTELCLLFVVVVLCVYDVQHVMMVHSLLSFSGSVAMKFYLFDLFLGLVTHIFRAGFLPLWMDVSMCFSGEVYSRRVASDHGQKA